MRDTVHLQPGAGAYLSQGPASTTPHEAHCLKLMLPLDGSVALIDGEKAPGAVLVAPNHRHAACTNGPALTLLWQPDDLPQALLERVSARPVVGLMGREARVLSAAATYIAGAPADLPHAATELLTRLPGGSPRKRHAVVARSIAHLETTPETSLADLATHLRVSPYHLSRLFRRDIGLSFRRWRLWQRTLRTFGVVLAGMDLASAAVEGGFSDQAHFTRTCRRLVGRSPAELLLRNSVQ